MRACACVLVRVGVGAPARACACVLVVRGSRVWMRVCAHGCVRAGARGRVCAHVRTAPRERTPSRAPACARACSCWPAGRPASLRHLRPEGRLDFRAVEPAGHASRHHQPRPRLALRRELPDGRERLVARRPARVFGVPDRDMAARYWAPATEAWKAVWPDRFVWANAPQKAARVHHDVIRVFSIRSWLIASPKGSSQH